ncbi:MAG: GGDEF domain-containing protein [Proteobacteria bacterium]|nr:MAG: GGDEF domain-containing protein [Pseudomonadota bacterium]
MGAKGETPPAGHAAIEAPVAAPGPHIGPEGDREDEHTTAILNIASLESERLQAAAYVTVLAGSRVGEMIKVTEALSVGRAKAAGLRVTDKGVSRAHLRLVPESKGVMLYDLDSRNGTFVNGKRVAVRLLEDGDKIQVGEAAILKFAYADVLEESFQQRMYDAAVRDPLTKLFNRRHLEKHLELELAFAARHNTPLCVLMMDIDHFKAVNDTYGHGVGDAVLHRFAELLASGIRNEDLAARYGGEEFVLVCRGIRGRVGAAVGDRLRQALEATTLVEEKPRLQVTMSVGVAAVPDGRYGDHQALLEAADKALYRAKERGRNRVELA